MIYLLHFERPYFHARHYLGFSDAPEKRIDRHTAGHGSKLVAAVIDAGIGFELARVWDGDRNLERKLHKRKNSCRLCPICREARKLAVLHG